MRKATIYLSSIMVVFIGLIGTVGYSEERLTPEQVGAEKRMTQILKEARGLAAQGAYEAAVRDYLHVYNFGRGAATLEAIRLSIVPAEVAALGEKYPPALNQLREEVRIRAGLILTGVAGTDEILEFVTLNRILNQSKRTLELYDQLKSSGERAREQRLLMRGLIDIEMLEARRFDELGQRTIIMAKDIATRIAHYEIERDFDSSQDAARNAYVDALQSSVATDGVKVFEALLLTNRVDAAGRLADRILTATNTVEMYSAMITLALANDHTPLAETLAGRAKRTLGGDDAAKVSATLTKKMPP